MTASTVNAIPKMTSNTTPSGQALASRVRDSGTQPYIAFDHTVSDSGWVPGGTSPAWLAYKFDTKKIIQDYSLTTWVGLPTSAPRNWTFEGSDNGSDWIVLDTRTNQSFTDGNLNYYSTNNRTPYFYYRINVSANNGYSEITIGELRMFEALPVNNILLKKDNKITTISKKTVGESTSIPNMTSNTTPSGIASASSESNGQAWYAFNRTTSSYSDRWFGTFNASNTWIKYEFTNSKKIYRYSIEPVFGDGQQAINRSPKDWTFEGSNDGMIWTVLDSQTNITTWVEKVKKYFEIQSPFAFKSYRLKVTATVNNPTEIEIGEIEMFEIITDGAVIELPSYSENNFIQYGVESPVEVNGMFEGKKYILQDTISENENNLWTTKINRKPLSIKFN